MPTYNAQDFVTLFKRAGAPNTAIPFMIAQTALESGNFTSNQLINYNNASGITWINSPKQKNAERGLPLPENPKYYYAHFDTLQDWANDYVRVLNLGIAKPLQATTLNEYFNRLLRNKYFPEEKAKQYAKALTSLYKKYSTKIDLNIVPLLVTTIIVILVLNR